MKYSCKYCKYNTDRKDNYEKHLKTKKHQYIKDHNEETNKINKLSNVNIKKIEEAANIIIENQKTQEKKLDKAIKTSTSLINYLLTHHPNTPALEEITDEKCKNLLLEKYDLKTKHIENYKLHHILIKDHTSDKLIDTIKDIILKIIKKDNIEEQSIFNTDLTRLNYVIKTSLNKWIEDKSGINFIKLVIKPVLKSIQTLLESYLEKIYIQQNIIGEKVNNYEKITDKENLILEKIINQQYSIETIIKNIKENKYNKILMKEISPYLRIITKDKQIDQEDDQEDGEVSEDSEDSEDSEEDENIEDKIKELIVKKERIEEKIKKLLEKQKAKKKN
jgi:hypothetical protein